MPAVGRNEDGIRSYIRQQEKKDAWLDQLNLWFRHHLQVVPKSGPRQRPRTAASSGSSRNAPGFAGGYLLLVLPMRNGDTTGTFIVLKARRRDRRRHSTGRAGNARWSGLVISAAGS